MRVRKLLIKMGLLAAAGVLYLIWMRTVGVGIPCPFRLMTGWKCPGCGVTHMLMALSRLDFAAAREENVFLFYTSPVIFFEILFAAYLYLKNKKMPRWNEAFLAFFCVLLLAFGVYRNFAGC